MTGKATFDPLVWANWEEKFFQEEVEAHRNAPAEEPTESIPAHDRMTSKEVIERLRWSMSKLRRNAKSRKLPYIKEDGKMWFRRANVEHHDEKRYVPAK